MSSYLYFIKVRILESLAYRFEAVSTMLIQFIILTVNVFFWKAVYASTGGPVQDTTLEEMLNYSIMSGVLSCFFSATVEQKIRQRVREGNVAVDFIKPINPFGMYFAEDVGGILVNTVQKAFALIIFACIFIIIPAPASAVRLLLFLISAIFSFVILWVIAAVFGVLNFWLIDIGNIGGVKTYIIAFLSGSIIPTWFFPGLVRRILAFTPFIYIYQTPVAIYIGRTPLNEACFAIVIQLVWAALLLWTFTLIKNRAMGRLIVQGG